MRLSRYLIAITLLLLAACGEVESPTPPTPPTPPKPEAVEQTLLMFLCGRGNLVTPFERNITNSLKALSPSIPGSGRILVFRQTPSGQSEITELVYDGTRAENKVLKVYSENFVTTEYATMTRILKDMLALAPAKRYGLVMGSHATGWVPADRPYLRLPTSSVAASDYWLKTGEPEARSFGYDGGKTMDIATISKVLTATQVRYDYLIFDACFMSSVEALYQLRNNAAHIIASPCEIMLYGFPYDAILPHLFVDGGKSYDLPAACRSFHEFYATTATTRQSGCIAATNCSQLEALANVIRRINIAGIRPYNAAALQTYEGLSPHLFYDLRDYIRAICNNDALRTQFDTQFDRTFPPDSRFHTPEFYTDYGHTMLPINADAYSGVSVSEPSSKYRTENRQTEWYKATHP